MSLTSSSITLIVGLGNPGPRYAKTRHNVGFRSVDLLAERHGLRFTQRQADSHVATGHLDGARVVVAKPQTYMNLSGRAMRGLLGRHRLSPEALIVVYDDLDLPFGRIRLRERGSAGGHKGIQSIIAALGTNEFRRVRIGIGRPPEGEDPVEYVLQPFDRAENRLLPLILETAADAVECWIREGGTAAMNKFNRDVIPT